MVRSQILSVLRGEVPFVVFPSLIRSSSSSSSVVPFLFPGSFNPLHAGHKQLAEAAQQSVGLASTVTFEISVHITDKGPVSPDDIEARVAQFRQTPYAVALTRAPLMIDKAVLFPGFHFIMGVDTLTRMLNPTYYEGKSVEGLRKNLQKFKETKVKFVVGGRLDKTTGQWVDPAKVEVLDGFQDLFVTIPEHSFRVDLSSTEIRAGLKT